TAAIRVIAAGLPGAPAVDIPVSLTVTGDPIAVVTPDALDFGEVFLNDEGLQAFQVMNDGVDALSVTSISSDNDLFEVLGTPLDETTFELEPGESTMVYVRFAPVELGSFSGTITVETNDPVSSTHTVEVGGVGIPAPAIAVAPTEFDLQAYAGQMYTRTFEISNTGGNPLTYMINEEDVATTAVEPVTLLEEAFEDGFPADWTVVTNGDPNVPWQLASDYGAPTSPNYASTGDAAMANSDIGQFLGGPSFDTEMWTPAITMDDTGFTLEYKVNFQDFLGNDFLDVDITTDGGATWTNMIQYTEDTCGDPDAGCFTPPNGLAQSIPLDGFVNLGETFQVRWRFWTLDDPSWEWWATIDDVAIVRNVEWLATSPTTGEIAPGESETITLNINADLPAGEYGATLVVTSNDPLSNGEFVDIDLTVIESVTVAPTPADGDEEVHPNESFLLPITVASLQDLGVESFQFTLLYDNELFEATGVVTEGSLSEGASVSTNTDIPGQINVAVAEGTAMTGTSSSVLFTVDAAAIDGDNPVLIYVAMSAKDMLGESEFAFEDFQFNEGEPPVSGSTGSISIVPLYGDVSLNLEVSSFDASLVLDAVVDAADLNEAATVAADVSGNGDVSALDASLILRHAAGDDEVACFPVDGSCSTTGVVAAVREASRSESASSNAGIALTDELSWGAPGAVGLASDASRTASGMLAIPLVLDASGPVYAIDFAVEIDPSLATVTAMEAAVPNGWLATHSVTDGVLRIAFSGATPLENGTIATVTIDRHQPDGALSLGGQARFDEASPVRVASISAETPPQEFALRGNFPNPTAGAAVISLDLPEDASVRVEVYDAIGRRVMQVEDDLKAGARQTISIQGRDLPAGVYVYRVFAELDGGTKSAGGRLTVVR
ncbi:MAG: choice-of-anchor D domain-containing protein, partial [Bacteroidota bacterium]